MEIDKILDNIFPLPEKSRNKIKEKISLINQPKGHILLEAEKVETSIYFIKKGIVRAYSTSSDTEITFWFGEEGETIISMRSYVENKKSYENIELLEACQLYELKMYDLQDLFDTDIHVANWGRKFAEKELIKTEERLISREFKPAIQRYEELLKKQPSLIRRVQLSHIASYLGITQVSLSRIRSEIR